MPNVMKTLRDEITRLARKEVKVSVGKVHKPTVQLKHDVAALKRTMAELEKQAGQFVLPARRERSYPRCVKPRPQKYSVKKANKNNASQA